MGLVSSWTGQRCPLLALVVQLGRPDKHRLTGFNETMIVYLLAIASPTHPVPAELYYSGWAGQSQTAIDYRRVGRHHRR